MKEFYAFLNEGYNFLGFLVFLGVVFTGLRELIKAAVPRRSCKCESKKQTEK